MSSEEPVKAEPCAGTFSGCLVDGDAAENARERKTKRRAVAFSIVLQSAGLAALLIAPLFAKPAELTGRIAVPIPPYRHSVAIEHSVDPRPTRPTTTACLVCFNRVRPIVRAAAPDLTNVGRATVDSDILIGSENRSADGSALSNIFDDRTQPRQPENPRREKRRIHETHIDPALLTRRIEPVYPPLARQLRKSGTVELHAVIATDGSVQSLEVVSGDPLFIISARQAVLQWHYKPTYLNGQPVEIDTYITVIYTLQ